MIYVKFMFTLVIGLQAIKSGRWVLYGGGWVALVVVLSINIRMCEGGIARARTHTQAHTTHTHTANLLRMQI